MPIAIIDKDRRWLQTVPDGYTIAGEQVTTPGGSSWTVPGAVAHESVTKSAAAEMVDARAEHDAATAAREEIRAAKRIVAMATKGAPLDAADEVAIEAEIGPAPARPVRYLSAAGNVVTTKPKAERVEGVR